MQRRSDRDDAEQKDHERRVIRWNGSSRRFGLLLRRERSGDRQNRYGVSNAPEKHRKPVVTLHQGVLALSPANAEPLSATLDAKA